MRGTTTSLALAVALGVALAVLAGAGLGSLPAIAGPDDGLRALGPTGQAPLTGRAPASRPVKTAADFARGRQICGLIEEAAETHGLPKAYFAKLIWRESRFDAKALSPKGAQGIAQFMPGTAKLVGLRDPWDPAQAIPASAAHLADLRRDLGNWGLAAAGYNAGAGRVTRWLAGRSRLPGETRAYVHAITGQPADWFRRAGNEVGNGPLKAGQSFADACSALPILKTRAAYAAAKRKPWGVQIAGNINRNRAIQQSRRIRHRFSRVLGGHSAQVIAKRGPRGQRPLWSVQIGANSRSEAIRLCLRLKAAGGACLVRKNG
ncbi:MAG: lytic transglycosylase domain-containing protein [Pseudomonadota bacterium]